MMVLVHPSIHSSIHSPIHLSIHPSIYPFTHPSNHPCIYGNPLSVLPREALVAVVTGPRPNQPLILTRTLTIY
jgi:hypothetical protein